MFSYVWSTANAVEVPDFKSKYNVTHYLPLMWIEHCIECSAPLCYSTCKIYKPRSDRRCLRFEHGVTPILFRKKTWGGQIQFRRWAKLESHLPNHSNGINREKNNRILAITKKVGLSIEKLMRGIRWSHHRPAKVVESIASVYLSKHKFKRDVKPIDGFLVTVYNHESINLTLLFEIVNEDKVIYKNSFDLNPGWNEFLLSSYEIPLNFSTKQNVRLYLDKDGSGMLTFKYLDFVSFLDNNLHQPKPAKRVKCVAWDLDNTLWMGVIGDTIDGKVAPNKHAFDLIEQFDKMGIIQTIVSKNTYSVAWEKIEQFGISDYFLYPAINWGRKSKNLMAIAKELNINIDTFALIDDSVFEREEVIQALPQVRVYDIAEIDTLLNKPEFDIPVTEESAKRRLSYKTECHRKRILASYGDDYDHFLKDCCMELTIFLPTTDSEKIRCLELLQRSNQYNISKIRRTEEDYSRLYYNNDYKIYAMQVADKYGSYGIVGFVSLHKTKEGYELTDFVMSCRVAQKKVERAFFNWLAATLEIGMSIYIEVYKTSRNKPLREELEKMPFDTVKESNQSISFRYCRKSGPFANDKIINVKYRD